MTFTKEPPTKPGAYWWKAFTSSIPRVAEVWKTTSGIIFVDIPGTYTAKVEEIGGEWCRLAPADELGKAHEEGWRDKAGPYYYQTAAFARSRAKRVMEGGE